MSTNTFRAAAGGFALGAAAVLMLGAAQVMLHSAEPGRQPFETIEDFNFAGKRGGKILAGEGGIAYAPPGTETKDLGPLTIPVDQTPGRFQAVALGDGKDFVVLDTATGLANVYIDSEYYRLYNVGRPNHYFEMRLSKHRVLE